MSRHAGILLHPTSLPGPYGIGDVGPGARAFADWLEAAGQTIWQVLPLSPVDAFGCPYASPSAFALEPLLLSQDDLVRDGWLKQGEKSYLPFRSQLDWDAVRARKGPVLHLAAERAAASLDLAGFTADHPWVADWALFVALAEVHGSHWAAWPEALRERDPAAVAEARDTHATVIARETALQALLIGQWTELRDHCRERGVRLWGDLPFLVGGDSADVWSRRALFRLDRAGEPTVVSGVPPDAFTPLGQLWGHPLYDNAAHAAEDHAWWCDRAALLLGLVDAVRLDHFRGIEAVWSVPADATDARAGSWQPGLGRPLLEALQRRLGSVPIIAEDLGIITPEVEALRDGFGLPGMAILQFAWDGTGDHPYQPHNHRRPLVVYTGTHDNDTTEGWYASADARTQDQVRRYLCVNGRDVAWDLMKMAWRSVADTAIAPMQDVLSLDGRARMNVPGQQGGNWAWRMAPGATHMALARRLRAEAELTGRVRPAPSDPA